MLPVLSQNESDLTACFVKDIAALLESFSEKETSGKQSLQQMLSSDQAAFSRAAVRVLAQATGCAGARYILHLLKKQGLLMEALADPRGSKQEDAVGAARTISQLGAPLESDVERVLSAALSQHPSAANSARVMRLLDLLEAASPQPRLYLFQTELLNHPDSAIRSRATLLMACTSKSGPLVSRMLLDEDVRVQANAVEALWTFAPEDALPLLKNAARSKIPRVAGNAAVGLYRIGDLSSFKLMFSMAQHSEPQFRATAAWAMGEAGDTRFLPFLTAWFPRSAGKERVHVLQALARIRRIEKTLAESGTIEIRHWDSKSTASDSPRRSMVLTLWSPEKADLSALKPTQFAIWAGGELVDSYEIAAQPNPALIISGFILPRFSSNVDPYAIAVRESIERCLKYKRHDDLWRIDRYLVEPRAESAAPLEKAALPYDESLLGSFAKTQQRGFLAVPEVLRKIAESPGPRERATDDAVAAFDRQSDAMIKFSGKRKLFLFLSEEGSGRLERHIGRLKSFIANERIAIHGFAMKDAAGVQDFAGLCAASEGGSFAMLSPDQIPAEVESIYAQMINRFAVSYLAPTQGEAAQDMMVHITSAIGCGKASFSS